MRVGSHSVAGLTYWFPPLASASWRAMLSGPAHTFEGLALHRLRQLLESVPDEATRVLIEIELERRIPLDDAASFNSVHRTTFKKHYGHLVERFGPRLELVKLRYALTLPPLSTR
jgi:hypothetical protein